MKHKTKNAPEKDKDVNVVRRRRELALSRLQARRAEKKQAAESERSRIYRKRLKNAPIRKAPLTSRTRGYYRFSKDYPGNVDENGMRENAVSKKRLLRQRLCLAAALIAVFCISFVAAKAAWLAAKTPPQDVTAPTQEEKAPLTAAMHFTQDALEGADASGVLARLKNAGCTVAVLEFKDVYGSTHRGFTPLMKALQAQGVKTAAYISCFKDTLHAAETPGLAVQTVNGAAGYWKDNGGSGWLNPFSDAARTLLLNTVRTAAGDGYDYILLDNVCFAADSGSAAAYYPGESEFTGTRNQLLTGFVNDAVAAAGSASTILMGKYGAFDPAAPQDRAPCFGPLNGTSAGLICADARFSEQQKNITVGGSKFANASDIPFAFVLAVGELAALGAGERGVVLCIENGGAAAEAIRAAGYAGAAGYILW